MTSTEPGSGRYPATRRADLVEILHGHEIADPYRWLEDADAPETTTWVQSQNACTEEYLGSLPERGAARGLLSRITGRPRAGRPVERGGRYVINRNNGQQDQDVWYVADSLADLRAGGRLLLDPNKWSDDGTTSVQGVSLSHDGSTLSYAVSEGGSDWNHVRHVDLATGEPKDDVPLQSKGFLPTWLPDGVSFVYASPEHSAPMSGTEAARLGPWQLLLHRVGVEQNEVLLTIPERPRTLFHPVRVSHDGRWLVVGILDGTAADNRLWLFPLTTADGRTEVGDPIRLIDEAYATFAFVCAVDGRLVVRTSLGAERGRVVAIDIDATVGSGALAYEELIPEAEHALTDVLAAKGELVTSRLVGGQARLDRHDLAGTHLGTIATPPGTTAMSGYAVWSAADREEWFVGWSTPSRACVTLRGTTGSNEVQVLDDLIPAGGDEVSDTVVTLHHAESRDGTAVPYSLVRRADLDPSVAVPTLLYGYGGFNMPVGPSYNPMFSAWLESGGAVAVANLRGGGEFGTAWYEGGRLRNKQNVFDDFIAVGEHLKATGVTAADGLVLHGSSNGGLLVGAVVTQRPDLAAAALPDVGVMDVLRFHRFTFGAAWVSDYGDPEVPEDFAVALQYSPVHNVRPARYCAVLVTTGDHDDRVVPSHSYKFAAELQRAQQAEAPVLVRIEIAAGHGLGKSTAQTVAEKGDMLAFAAHHAGLRVG